LACEITPEGVLAARRAAGEQTVMTFAPLSPDPLSPDVVRPGLGAPNFADPAAVIAALRKALDDLGSRDKVLTLIVPDAAVRVLILDFDSLPPKPQDALPIVRFRLRKLAPFEVDDAAVSYQVIRQQQHQARVLVTVMPAPVRAEYEDGVRAAGYEPGVVLPSMLASLAALGSADAALVVNRSGLSLTTAITNGDELLLHRTLELPASYAAQSEELAQVVSVARAYFEDTLNMAPRILYYNGPGGAEEFASALGRDIQDNLQVRDLVSVPLTGSVSALPKGLAAGVMGALAS
jgi:type IV pilus assembly protein PilM